MRTARILVILMISLAATTASSANKKQAVVEVGGMSIIGNRELPKSLYIVPWKDTDVNHETDISSDLLDERLKVVDKEEFVRQLKYYELSN